MRVESAGVLESSETVTAVSDAGLNRRTAGELVVGPQRIPVVLTVADVRAVVAWYGRTFGFVEHVKIGRRVFFRPTDLEDYIERHRRAVASP